MVNSGIVNMILIIIIRSMRPLLAFNTYFFSIWGIYVLQLSQYFLLNHKVQIKYFLFVFKLVLNFSRYKELISIKTK